MFKRQFIFFGFSDKIEDRFLFFCPFFVNTAGTVYILLKI